MHKSSAKGPVTSQSCSHHTPLSSSPVGHEQGKPVHSSQHCLALGMATAPRDGHSPPPAPEQPAGVSSSHPVLHVELLAFSEPCNVLMAHVIRLHFPLSLFSLRKPSCTMSIFSTSWSWIRRLTCGLPSSKGKISTFFSSNG